MFEKIMSLIKKVLRLKNKEDNSKDAAKERLHLVLIQDRASVSADFLEVMKQEIIEVIKKYIEIDEKSIDVRLTNNLNDDGKGSSPALYANFPITNVKTKILKEEGKDSVKNDDVDEQQVDAKTEEFKENIEQDAINIVEEEAKN